MSSAIDSRPPPRRRGTKLGLLLAGVVMALAATEIALQIVSYGAWASRQPASTSATGEGPVVLCVGDSYTFGVGASAPSRRYPVRLQEHLRSGLPRQKSMTDDESFNGTSSSLSSEPVAVINGGWPGQSSREVLLRLGGQLEQHRPTAVCVLVGINDLGYAVPRVPPGEEHADAPPQGFPVKFRLGLLTHHLVEWLRGGSAYSLARREARPFLGVWHGGGKQLRFEPDGRLETLEWPMRWSLDGDQLVLEVAGKQRATCGWEMDGEDLLLQFPGAPAIRLEPGPLAALSGLEQAERDLAEGRAAAALTVFRNGLDQPVAQHRARGGVARCLRALGRDREAAEETEVLIETWRAGNAAAAEPALMALLAAGAHQRMLELTLAMADTAAAYPLPALFDKMSLDGEEHARFQRAVAAVLASAELSAAVRSQLLRARFHALKAEQPAAALRALLTAELEQPQAPYTYHCLLNAGFAPDMVTACLDDLEASSEQREHLAQLQAGALPELQGTGATLPEHLERIVALCRDHGAEPVLLIYPFPMRQQAVAVRDVARRQEVQVVSPVERFEKLLLSRRWEELFVASGHCSDEGYDIFAGMVADGLLPLLRQPR